MYVMNCTRLDSAYSINKLSRFTSNPSMDHQKAIKKYLRHTMDYGLHYTSYPAILKGYSDANWIPNTKDLKSTSGYVLTIYRAVVSWKSSIQICIARSMIKSDFIALDKAKKEAQWIKNFLDDILYWPKPVPPIYVHCYSQSAIENAQSTIYDDKSRHICHTHNTIKHLLSNEIISINYVKSG